MLRRGLNSIKRRFFRYYLKYKGVDCDNIAMHSYAIIKKHKKAIISLGNKCVINNLSTENLAGINHRTILAAPFEKSAIIIGNNVGLSGTSIYARGEIRIGDNVMIGVNVSIYDNDFHPVNPEKRLLNDFNNIAIGKVHIQKNVWIGANSIVLKGVTIGENSIIGAGSIVSKNIPTNVIAAGNPASVIRELNL